MATYRNKNDDTMANGIAIKDVDNKLQSLGGEEVIPISTGADEPEVVEVDTLKEYINEDIDTALEGKQDVINDLATIRNGAALGATALQSYTESDPTVPTWAKAEQKPSYTASEVGAVPTTRKINNKALSSDITLTAADVNALPSSTVIPTAQIQSDWNQSNTSAKDYIKNKPTLFSGDYNDLSNKPTIPTVPTNVSAFTNDAGYITGYTETDPTVPSWAKASTKPSYTASEVGALPDTTVVPTESTVTGWGFTKNAGTITGITMNDASKGTSGVVDLGTVITDISGCMPITGSITASTNLSNITAGVYSIEGVTHSDFPTNPIYGTLIQGTGQYKPQILIGGGAGASNVYTRRWLTGSLSWTAWTDSSVPTNIVTGLNSSGVATAYTIKVVDSLPSTTDASTIYLVTGS